MIKDDILIFLFQFNIRAFIIFGIMVFTSNKATGPGNYAIEASFNGNPEIAVSVCSGYVIRTVPAFIPVNFQIFSAYHDLYIGTGFAILVINVAVKYIRTVGTVTHAFFGDDFWLFGACNSFSGEGFLPWVTAPIMPPISKPA
jgi:hypothetical protein